MSTPKDPKNRLAVVMDALAEQVESMSDQEVLDDAAAEGIDVKAEGDRVRGLLLGVLDDGSFAVRATAWPIVVVTAAGRDGGAEICSFSGPGAVEQAEAFRREQESYGCTVKVRVWS